MTASTTSSVYIQVIEDVVSKIRDEFVNDGGPGEAVLIELQGIWEMKMMQSGVLCGPIDRSSTARSMPGGSITPVGDLNMPYEATEEFETPTAEILFPPTPLQTPIQTPFPCVMDNPSYIPTGSSEYAVANDNRSNSNVNDAKPGRPSLFMPPPSPWMNQRPPLAVDVNVAYEEGREEADRGTSNQALPQSFLVATSGKRKREDIASKYHTQGYIPQQDGAGDSPWEANQPKNSIGKLGIADGANRMMATGAMGSSSRILQLDGPVTDPYDDALSTPNIYNYQGAVTEDYTNSNTPAPNDLQVSRSAPSLVQMDVVEEDLSEPSLNENDDDDDFDDVDQGEDLNTRHLVLAQFDKVTRAKSRWKCTLKDGIMHINDTDLLFNKANGEFEF